MVLSLYAGLLNHYRKKWKRDRIDKSYQDRETAQKMRKEYGFEEQNLKKIPKRRIKNRATRIKHGY